MAIKTCTSRLIVNGFDWSLETSGFTITGNVSVLDAPNIAMCTVPRIPGQADFIIDQNGYMSFPDGLDKVFFESVKDAPDTIVTAVLDVNNLPGRSWTLDRTYAGEMTIEMPAAELLTVTGQWSTPKETLRGWTAMAGDLDGASIDMDIDPDAGAEAGGAFVWHLTNNQTDTPSATFVVSTDSDPGFGTATTMGTFDTGGEVAGVGVLTGTAERYVRVEVTATSHADLTGVASVAIPGVTY